MSEKVIPLELAIGLLSHWNSNCLCIPRRATDKLLMESLTDTDLGKSVVAPLITLSENLSRISDRELSGSGLRVLSQP